MLYNFLNVNKKYAESAFKIQRNIKGLECTIWKPHRTKTVYGLEDSLIEYDCEPIKQKHLVYNLFQEGMIGCSDFDAFISNPYILTLYDEKLELKSRVEVDFQGSRFNFTIDEIKSPTPHIKTPVFLAHILVAAT